ncbi:MAG: di-trans,poly-cis-decaprenylcistransferase [Chloroflexi bacterium]|nr:MAG: di-trans,poly-cis-decaprenylcistransferase [Chloroflexota bacterium]
MDGNRRWARARHLPAIAGHRAGVEALRRTLRAARTRGIHYVTAYAFSSENWQRADEEVRGLLRLLEEVVTSEVPDLVRDGVRLRVIGRLWELPEGLQRAIAGAMERTAAGTANTLTIAFNYGGRKEIVDAARALVRRGLDAEAIDEEAFASALYTVGTPDPELLIRTGGETRVSNFLLWQVAYAEMHATTVLWPDFAEGDLDRALADYASRDRRFGR